MHLPFPLFDSCSTSFLWVTSSPLGPGLRRHYVSTSSEGQALGRKPGKAAPAALPQTGAGRGVFRFEVSLSWGVGVMCKASWQMQGQVLFWGQLLSSRKPGCGLGAGPCWPASDSPPSTCCPRRYQSSRRPMQTRTCVSLLNTLECYILFIDIICILLCFILDFNFQSLFI